MLATMRRSRRVLTNRLSRLMGDRRLTITDVAEGAGLDWNTVAGLYHARATRVDFATLEKLCDFLEVGPEQFLEWRPGRREGGGAEKGPARRRRREREALGTGGSAPQGASPSRGAGDA